jgi:hypothetical protein
VLPDFFSRADLLGLCRSLAGSSILFFLFFQNTSTYKEWFLLPLLLLLCLSLFFLFSFFLSFSLESVYLSITILYYSLDALFIIQKSTYQRLKKQNFLNNKPWIKVHYKNKSIHYDISYEWKKYLYQKHFKSKFFFNHQLSKIKIRLRQVDLFIHFIFLYVSIVPIHFAYIV